MLGLKGRARTLLAELAKAHARGDLRAAWAQWLALCAEQPGHAEVLRWSAVLHLADGHPAAAVDALQGAVAACPDDPELLRLLGSALAAQSQHADALQALRAAAQHSVRSEDWLELGIAFDRLGEHDDALAAADAVLALDPAHAQARLLRARCLQALGHAREAAADYRRLIRADTLAARAWFALVDMKTEALAADERSALARADAQATDPDTRVLLAFALGNAQEMAGELPVAFATLARANRAVAAQRQWNAAAFVAQVDAMGAAFANVCTGVDAARGAEVVFIVGLPRSGSTLVEQVLAAHPDVQGASELPHLEHVIARESQRRQQPLARWAAQATATDWARLGNEYLAHTARWRTTHRVSTDKMPSNWLLAGALRAMLPGARIIDSRRDALETCWSCYKQLFAQGLADYAYTFADLATYSTAQRDLARQWSMQHPAHYRVFDHESLVADPEPCVRNLLAFCDLAFDARCLQPHLASRGVRTASAAQVRQPMRRAPNRSEAYGALLDPLRSLLADARS